MSGVTGSLGASLGGVSLGAPQEIQNIESQSQELGVQVGVNGSGVVCIVVTKANEPPLYIPLKDADVTALIIALNVALQKSMQIRIAASQ